MQIIEIFDPELAMCLHERGYPTLYRRKENGLGISAFKIVEGFSAAFEELDEDEGCSIVRIYDTDDGPEV